MTQFETTLPRRAVVGMIGVGALTLLVPAGLAAAKPNRAIKIYKNAGCGCCGQWAAILRKSGFDTRVVNVDDVTPFKRLAGVPAKLESCHTGFIGGYVIEGHVPVAAIEKLLTERPAVAGLAVPGMPMGSPGMPSPDPEPFDVIAFTATGGQRVFMRFR